MSTDATLDRIRFAALAHGDAVSTIAAHSLSEYRGRHLGRAASYLLAAAQEIEAAARSVADTASSSEAAA